MCALIDGYLYEMTYIYSEYELSGIKNRRIGRHLVLLRSCYSRSASLRKTYEGKTSLKYTYHNRLLESDSIRHSDSTGADNGNKRALRGGQDDQTVACLLNR